MKKSIIPPRLQPNGHIRVIAPSRSRAIVGKESIQEAVKNLENSGFAVSFSDHCDEVDDLNSSSIQSRVSDIHSAFSDKSVDAILTVIGGYNSNQLLQYLDYKLIASNPKILCGFSDITAVANAITAKTGMITYIGPHFSSWAMKYGFDYSKEYFFKSCLRDETFIISPSKTWSDDPWYLDQENRDFIQNEGYWIFNYGTASGRIIGGHMRCLNALQGTSYWPSLDDSILIVEEDAEIFPALFDRQLQSLIHQKDFNGVRAILIGRFQKESNISREILEKIIRSKKELYNIPIIGNVNLGHTTPIATFPIGGSMTINTNRSRCEIKIIEH